jgi:hypothetical protein
MTPTEVDYTIQAEWSSMKKQRYEESIIVGKLSSQQRKNCWHSTLV